MFNRKSGKKFIFLLFIGLLIVAAISLTCGQIKIPLHNTLSAIGYQLGLPFFDKNDFITGADGGCLVYKDAPYGRGTLVGAALGISGAVCRGFSVTIGRSWYYRRFKWLLRQGRCFR